MKTKAKKKSAKPSAKKPKELSVHQLAAVIWELRAIRSNLLELTKLVSTLPILVSREPAPFPFDKISTWPPAPPPTTPQPPFITTCGPTSQAFQSD